MSAFGGLIMTNRGRVLQTKAQTGVQLTFTRIALGDGSLSGQSILELNQLINEKKSVSITKLKTQPDGKAVVGAVLSNQDITTGFYWREIGVFAQDPDIGEILYCYGNAGSAAEYIPAGGGSDIIEKNIDIITIVGNASSVSATINQSLVLETPEGAQGKVDAHANDTTKHITEAERIAWNSKADQNHTHAFSDITGKPTTLAGYGITNAVSSSDVVSTPTANKILKLDANAKLPASITGNADGNAATASKLQTARTISLSGDVTGSASFDGSENATISATLTNSGVTPGTYPKVTVDEKGRVTEGQSLSASDIPNLDWSKITTGKPTTLAGYGITDAETPTGAQAKADQAEANAKTYADQKVSEHSADYVKHPGYGVATGSANAYAVTLNPAPTSYVEGMAIAVKINVDNTGSSTINVNGLGAKAIKKPNGNNVSAGNLKAGSIYTLRYNGTNFILQGEGGEYGNATPADVRNTKTLGTENGVVQGTLDLSLLTPSNIKKGITIDGVLGTLPYLPNDFIGAMLYKKDNLTVGVASSAYYNVITANNLFIFIGGDYNCYKYDIVNKTLTNLGRAWATNPPIALCASDDGSVVYVRDSNGAVYYWNGTSWVSTGITITVMVTSSNFCCSPNGDELYYFTGSNGGVGTQLKKFVKSTGSETIIAAIDKLIGEPNLMRYVDDGSVWVGVNESPVTYKKIRITDGAVLASINRPAPFTRYVCMFRKSTYPYYGIYYGSPTGSGGSDIVYRLNKDGTSTQLGYSAPYGQGSFIASLTGESQAFRNNSGAQPYTLQFLKLQNSTSPIATYDDDPVSSVFVALSEDGCRWAKSGSYYIYSYFLYQ
ncbi:hypothetical protein CI793_13535 [Anoxybacillus ayderensis]|nr:hypothetical protein CI793_13535 [Anoxybacillus ayderensis]